MIYAYCSECERELEQDDEVLDLEQVETNIYEKVTGTCPVCGRKYKWFNIYCFHCVEDVEEV